MTHFARNQANVWNQRIFYELLRDYTKDRRWLDLGCGRGATSAELIRVRKRMQERLYVGLDLDMDSLRECKEENRVCGSMDSLPFSDGCFDIVTSNMVLEHIDDPVAVLQEANRVLDEEGILIIHTASSLHYMLLVGRLLSKFLPRKVYVRLVSEYTGRKEEDIFPTRYMANTRKKLSRAASSAGFRGGLLGYLDTPLSCFGWMRTMEEFMRLFLPVCFRGTILAVYIKRRWV